MSSVSRAADRLAHETAPPPAGGPEIRALLRRETEQSHAKLHAHAGLDALASGQLDRDGYVRLLLDLLPLHTLVEQRLSSFTAMDGFDWHRSFRIIPPVERLRSDLCRLNARAAEVPDLAWLLPPFDTQASALGCAWVIEGSALGARVLSRSLMRSLAIGPDNGGAFFAPQPCQQERWLACCARIDAHSQDCLQRERMVAAAKAIFDSFLLWLNGRI